MKQWLYAAKRVLLLLLCTLSLMSMILFTYAYRNVRLDPENFYQSETFRELLEDYIREDLLRILSTGKKSLTHENFYDLEIEIVSGGMGTSAYPGYKVGDMIFVRNPYIPEKEQWVSTSFAMDLEGVVERIWTLGPDQYVTSKTGTCRVELTVKYNPDVFFVQNVVHEVLHWAYDRAPIGLVASASLCLMTMVILALQTGRDAVSKPIRQRWMDKIVLEIWLLGAAGLFLALRYSYSAYMDLLGTVRIEGEWMQLYLWPIVQLLLLLWAVSFYCVELILTLVVRMRCGTLMSSSSLLAAGCIRLMRWFVDVSMRFHSLPAVMGTSVLLLSLFVFLGIRLMQEQRILWLVLLFVLAAGLIALYIWAAWQMQQIVRQARGISRGERPQVHSRGMRGSFRELMQLLSQVDEGLQIQVEERMKSERMRSELITNVSHDIKTPLTAFISYVDLMEKEESASPKVREYTAILARQARRLKKLTDDLFEMSKAASGTLIVRPSSVDLTELLVQCIGDYEERLEKQHLKLILHLPEEEAWIQADGAMLYRVMGNLFSNLIKYAMPGTRVYLDLILRDDRWQLALRNISADPLERTAEELMERFTRGDNARSSEGSGLGLAIARQLTEINHGTFTLHVDGDLFRVDLEFPRSERENDAE